MNTSKLAVFCGALLLGACGDSGSPGGGGVPNPDGNPTSTPTPKNLLQLDGFAGCGEFRDYYAEALAQEYLTVFEPCWGCEVALDRGAPVLATDDAGAPESADSAGGDGANFSAPPQDVTQTNTQEEGVDEADLIEADPDTGDFYIISQFSGELLVVDSIPAETMSVRARVRLPTDNFPQGLYLDAENDRLVVIAGGGYFYATAGGGGFAEDGVASDDAAFAPQGRFGTELLFYDVSDASNPRLVNRFFTEGFSIDSRRIGERVHLVTSYGFGLPRSLQSDDSFFRLVYEDYQRAHFEGDQGEINRLTNEIKQRVATAVANAEIGELLPAEAIGEGPEQTLACEAVLRPDVPERLGLVMITSIDTDGSDAVTVGTINNAWQIYSSQDNLYLLQSSGGWWFAEEQTQQMAIYQFALDDDGPAVPQALGLVEGWVNNSYSLSEYDGHLRVVTTEGRFDRADGRFRTTNHLFVLGAGLNTVGAVRDFIRDERVFSARFIAERGFVVTFEQVDPLFTFDLSTPSNPVLRGQVEIPGFSTYIHPLGPDHLLTIGRAGGEGGIGTGNSFQLQVFDVSNLDSPVRVADESPDLGPEDYAFSLAEYDPHAFTFYADEGLLSIPVQLGSPRRDRSFSGFFAYQVTTTSIDEYARIDHKQEGNQSGGCPPNRFPEDGSSCSDFAPVIYSEPLRSVIIKEGAPAGRTVLYTLSSFGLKALSAGVFPLEVGVLPLQE